MRYERPILSLMGQMEQLTGSAGTDWPAGNVAQWTDQQEVTIWSSQHNGPVYWCYDTY